MDGQVGAASTTDWGGLVLLHHDVPGAPQHVMGVRVHPFARPEDLLGRLAVAPSMGGSVAIRTLSELAPDTAAQLAIEVVEEV
ncbi:MAG: hypothetical protein OXP10_01370 [Chloroflexota bacterium]|nr:hypothetical protein [Chloroflexota bacterium]MDE2940984.1 hypothetical protein [Chloroflexota bacterium]